MRAAQSRSSTVRLFGMVALLAAMLVTTAGDWPRYLYDDQNSAANGSETILSPANAGQLTKLWSFPTGGAIAASPTVVGGTVYVGSWDGYEYALDAATGAFKWKTYLGVTTAPNCSPPAAGVSSSATVQDGVVYVGGGDAYWYALDAATGNVLWKVYTGDNSATGGHYNWSSPLIYNGYAYIGVASMGDCPLVQGQLLQVSLSTHQVVNTFNVVPNGQVGGGLWTSPSIDTSTNTVYVTAGTLNDPTQTYSQAIIALDASTLAVKSSWQVPPAQTVVDSDWGNSPLLFQDTAGDNLVAASDKNGFVYAFDRADLTAGPLWQQQIANGGTCPTCGDGTVSSGAFGNGRLYMAGGSTTINGAGYRGAVRALDPATGNFLWEHGAPGPVIPALAYANGLVIDGAGATMEVLNAATGVRLYSYTTGGALYGPPSVANGQIFEGSTDGNVYAFGLSGAPTPTPVPDPTCPNGWSCQDIGNPAPAGSETVSAGTWQVTAGGAGIGGTSDQFRLLAQSVSGDTQISAQVVSQQASPGSGQAGLMVRQTNDPAAPNYGVFLTPGNKLVVQYRTANGGGTTAVVQQAVGALPLYLRIQRTGDQFVAATSTDGVNYAVVPGSSATVVMPPAVAAGVAVSSGANGTASTATYSSVTIGAPGPPPNTPTPTTPCPGTWSCGDIGNPALLGNQSLSSGTWTLQGAGSDIGGYADQFHFVWQSLSSDATVSARVVTQANTNGSAKAGVMLRASTDPGAPYYGAFMTPGNGIVVQYRATQGLNTVQATSLAGAPPAYLEVTRSGSTFSTYTSNDGSTWTYVPGTGVTLGISGTVLAGLAISSHNTGTLSTATFDSVSIAATAPPPPTICPSGWTCADIGNPLPAGSQSLSGGAWTILGSGGDIFGTADQFRYVWQSLTGDGSVTARVVSQTNTDVWAKAGVMLRGSTDAGAPYYAAFLTPGNGITVQYRATQGASTAHVASAQGVAPVYLEVARSGNTYTAYSSSDGVTWAAVAGSNVTLSISSTVLAGMAVTSHNVSKLGSATFDTVSVSTSVPPSPTPNPTSTPVPCASNWSCADVGSPALAGSQTLSGGSWTVQGAGGDIWGTSDQFHYVWQSLSGDGGVSARVVTQTNTSGWAKAGVMLRASTDPGAPYYFAFVTPGNGIAVQYRTTAGGSAGQSANITGAVPVYLKVARVGSTYTAYTSSDGVSWTAVAGSSVSISMGNPVLAGLAVTSHNSGVLGSATFDTVSVSGTQTSTPTATNTPTATPTNTPSTPTNTPSTPTNTPTATPTNTPTTPTATATATTTPTATSGCPTGWSCADVGSPALAGSQTLSGGTWTVQAGGSDIWGTSDQFHYVWQSLSGDGGVSARVITQTNTSSNAKAGVMLRASTNAGAAYYFAFVTPSRGLFVQYRTATGITASQATTTTGTAPVYLKVARVGSTYTAYTSSDGVSWTAITNSGVTLNLGSPVLAGMAVTSHNVSKLGSATFDTVSVSTAQSATATPTATPTNTPSTPTNTPTATNTPSTPTNTPTATTTNTPTTPTNTPTATTTPTATSGCPTGWSCADVGSPALAGSQTLSGSTWTVQGAGGDIWGTSDQFHYVWQTLSGDGGVSARVITQTNTSSNAKAGVMLRASTNAGAAFYDVVVGPASGVKVQYRATPGGTAATKVTISGAVPVYLKVARVGSTYTAYTSSDGASWTAVAGSSVTLNLGSPVLAGMAVTSHNVSKLGSATFDTVLTG